VHGIRFADLGDDVRDERGESPHDGVQVEIAGAVWQALAEHPVGIRNVRHLGGRPELLDVAAEVEPLVATEPEQRRVGRRERAKQRGMRGVEREAELGDPCAPVEQMAPVPAERREEDAAGSHPQDRRDVLDQRRDAALAAGVGVEAQEALNLVVVDARAVRAPLAPELVRALRREEMDREHRRTDAGREFRAALDAGARLVIEPVHAHVRPARPGHRRLGRDREVALRERAAGRLDHGGDALVALHVVRHQAQLDPSPGAAREALRDLVGLRRGLEQGDGVEASRHRAPLIGPAVGP
jgi:hypothetical protein